MNRKYIAFAYKLEETIKMHLSMQLLNLYEIIMIVLQAKIKSFKRM